MNRATVHLIACTLLLSLTPTASAWSFMDAFHDYIEGIGMCGCQQISQDDLVVHDPAPEAPAPQAETLAPNPTSTPTLLTQNTSQVDSTPPSPRASLLTLASSICLIGAGGWALRKHKQPRKQRFA